MTGAAGRDDSRRAALEDRFWLKILRSEMIRKLSKVRAAGSALVAAGSSAAATWEKSVAATKSKMDKLPGIISHQLRQFVPR